MSEVTIVAHHVGGARGGMERQLVALVEGLLTQGFGVTVVARECVLDPHPRLRFVRVRVPPGPFGLAFAWFMVAASVAIARHGRGTLHTTGAIVLNRAAVSTVHFCHHAYNAANGARPPWRRMAAAAERLVYRHRTEHVVAASDGVAAELDRYLPGLRVRVIPNGVDTARFKPDLQARAAFRAHHGIDDGDLVAAFVGGDWERKGLEHAIAALEHAPSWRLAVAGRGDPRPAERVLFLGPVPDPEALLAAADAFVLPSRYEAMSLAILEGAAAGLPLLVGRVSGADAVLAEGETGWFVERDGQNIAQRLRALEDPALRAKLGAAARERAQAYGWDEVVGAYAEVYAA